MMQPHFRHLVSPLTRYTGRGITSVARPTPFYTGPPILEAAKHTGMCLRRFPI
jgi:hypothetical protein